MLVSRAFLSKALARKATRDVGGRTGVDTSVTVSSEATLEAGGPVSPGRGVDQVIHPKDVEVGAIELSLVSEGSHLKGEEKNLCESCVVMEQVVNVVGAEQTNEVGIEAEAGDLSSPIK